MASLNISTFLEAFFGLPNFSAKSEAANAQIHTEQSDIEHGTGGQIKSQHETPPNYGLYHRFVNTQNVYLVLQFFALINVAGKRFDTEWIGVGVTVFVLRLLWTILYTMKYPWYFGIRYHRNNLYKTNHLIQHSRIVAIFWFVFAAFVFMSDIGGIGAGLFYVIQFWGPVKFSNVDESQYKYFWFGLILNIWMAILDIRILCNAQTAISPAEIAANKLIFVPTNINDSSVYRPPSSVYVQQQPYIQQPQQGNVYVQQPPPPQQQGNPYVHH